MNPQSFLKDMFERLSAPGDFLLPTLHICCQVLVWGSMGTDSLLEQASSGHLRNYSYWHFSVASRWLRPSSSWSGGGGRAARPYKTGF